MDSNGSEELHAALLGLCEVDAADVPIALPQMEIQFRQGEEIMTKKEFLIDQAIANSISAAFQHAGVYVKGLRDDDKRKACVRTTLGECLRNLGSSYAHSVTDDAHCVNISNVAETMTEKFRGTGILRDGQFRIGVAQKALNLYVKYLWCLGDIPAPPHCPLDRRIIDKLSLKEKNRKDYDWTKIGNIAKYEKLIEKCREVAGGTCLAEWELENWIFLSQTAGSALRRARHTIATKEP